MKSTKKQESSPTDGISGEIYVTTKDITTSDLEYQLKDRQADANGYSWASVTRVLNSASLSTVTYICAATLINDSTGSCFMEKIPKQAHMVRRNKIPWNRWIVPLPHMKKSKVPRLSAAFSRSFPPCETY